MNPAPYSAALDPLQTEVLRALQLWPLPLPAANHYLKSAEIGEMEERVFQRLDERVGLDFQAYAGVFESAQLVSNDECDQKRYNLASWR